MPFVVRPLSKLLTAALFLTMASPVRAADPAGTPALPPVAASTWTMLVDMDARFTSWSGARGYPVAYDLGARGRGSQFYMPVAVQVVGLPNPDLKIELLARTGWVDARQSSGGGLAGHVSTMTDTVVSGTFTYLGTGGIQPFVSINANLPTGSANLAGTRAFARMDPDLVEVANYGEGFNLGATLGANISLGEFTLITTSLSHTQRGAYTRDPVTGFGDPDNRMQPGSSTSGTLQIAHLLGAFVLKASATMIYNNATRLDGAWATRPGTNLAFNASAAYRWNPEHSTIAAMSFTRATPNYIFDFTVPGVVREPANSNSNALLFRLDHSYRMSDQLTLGAYASWFNRDANAYDPTSFAFSPAKTKWALGGSARYAVTANTALTLRAEHFWVTQRGRPDVVDMFGPIPGTAIPALSFTGWTVALGGNVAF